jgi:N-glycosylase/DNA lyase
MEQEYKIENIKSFELVHIFECGQCFRWNKEADGSYTGVFGKNVLNVQKQEDTVIFKGICDGDIKQIITDYFDLNRDYEEIKEILSKIDENMETSVKYGKGIRILNQDLWEMIISYIISANNNIPRIKGIIERLSKNYGDEIIWNKKSYYTFPTAEQLKDVTVVEYRKLGLGFRDIRVYETTHKILNKEIDLDKLKEEKDTLKVREELLKLSGVGPKVADCILLFSTLKRFDFSNRCLGKASYERFIHKK